MVLNPYHIENIEAYTSIGKLCILVTFFFRIKSNKHSGCCLMGSVCPKAVKINDGLVRANYRIACKNNIISYLKVLIKHHPTVIRDKLQHQTSIFTFLLSIYNLLIVILI